METISSENNIIKMASSNISVLNSNAHTIIQAEMTKHPTALFFRAKAIVADETNSNGDYFSQSELKKSYQTFVGVPFFTNHNNQNVEDARGKIIYADWNDKDNAVYVVGFVDREAYPHICRGIEEDYMRGVSMGCAVDYSVCSICKNKADSVDNYCFIPGTPILMSDLTVKPIEDILIGDIVIDAFGKTTKVTKLFQREISEDIQIISSRAINGALFCTSNHPFLVMRRNGYKFINAGDIGDKEILLTPIRNWEANDNIFDQIQFEKSEENKRKISRLIGYYAAEGCIASNNDCEKYSVEFSLGRQEQTLINDIKDIALSLFGKEAKEFCYPERSNGTSVRIYCPELASFLSNNVPGKAKTKKFSSEVLSLPINLLTEVVRGYVDGDGSVHNATNNIIIHTASVNLAYQVFNIFITLGLSPSINSYIQPGGPTNREKRCEIYRITLGASQSKKIALTGGEKIALSASKEMGKCKLDNVFTLDKKFVKHTAYQIIEQAYEGTVHNIETESHSYVANNTSVHNCAHIKNRKGRKFSGTAKDVNTGEIKTFRDAPVYEENYGIKFIELSGVADPACKSCKIGDVFENKSYLQKAASVTNNIYMYKESSLFKESSQEDIDQLNQVLTTLENLSVALVQNRQQVDVEFASDLVKILSELQEFTDELTGAGYAQVQGKAQEIPGVEAEQTPEVPPAPEQPIPTQQTGLETAGAPIGKTEIESISPTITGEPSKPMASKPRMPTAPAKPIAETIIGLKKLAEQISKGEKEDMNRRLPKTVQSQQNEVMNVLEKSLKDKGQIHKYNEQDIINNDNGGIKMSQKIASRQETSEVITEAQLEQKGGYHPREDAPRNEITQAQLDGKRKNDEKEVITEKQLDSKRTQEEQNSITQKQLEGKRTGEEKNQITQGQLADEGYKSGTEIEVITEKQLEDKTDFWKRASLNRKEVKTAKEHVASVISVLADTAIDCSSTPEQIVSTVEGLTNSVKSKTNLLENITDEKSAVENEIISSSSRMKYWGKKGVKIAEMTKDNLKDIITSKLNVLVAKDSKTDPEAIVDVLDALVDSKAEAIDKIASAIDTKLAETDSSKEVKSRKDEIRDALKSEKASSDESKIKREGERKVIVDSLKKEASIAKKASHIIQTSLDEIGLDKKTVLEDKALAKKIIAGFAQGTCVSNNMKLAGITNVKIDEKGRVDIAISTEGEDDQQVEVSLPPSEDEIMPTETTPEGDTTGDNLDNLLPETPETPAATPAPLPAPAPQVPPIGAKSKVAIKKVAQTPNQAPGMGMGGQPNAALPIAAPGPAMGEPVQSLTQDEPEAGVGEADSPGQFPAGSKCPFCGSSDVDVGGKGKEPGFCSCKDCGSEYEISVNIEVLNPAEMSFEEEGKKIPEPKEPELPEMPVAASIKLNKGTILKLASLEKSKGYVCPACGQTECKPAVKVAGHVACVCPACETKFEHDALINVNKPDEGILNVSWKLDPKKTSANCESCKEAAKKFASKVKIMRMMKKAEKSKFPTANCVERLARRWGANAVSTFGPCKGKPLSECVCKELERYGFTSINKMNKLAEAMTQEDPMAKCLKDQLSKGYKQAQAGIICNALKKKYATKEDDNIFLMAFNGEADLNEEDLDMMNAKSFDEVDNAPVAEEGNIGDALPALDKVEETVTIELPADIAEEIKVQLEEATDVAATVPEEVEIEIEDGEPELGSGSNLEVAEEKAPLAAKSTIKITKEAKKPEKVENVEKDVKNMPRGDAAMGKEGPDNINKKVDKPSIPEGKGTMGNEGPTNIDVKAELPEIPTGDAYMGKEKETQKGMPANNVEIKGTVIAKNDEKLTKEATQPQQVKNMDSKVDVPKGKATMGEESAKNIDVALAEPKIPRGDAKMGEESKENIDKPAKEVDVPTGDAYMGKEKEMQKNMPANTVESLGTVRLAEEKKAKQLERLATARHEKACLVAAQLLGQGRIKSEDMDDIVKDLSKLELDRIESFASKIYPKIVREASSATLTSAVIMESKGIEIPQEETLKDKLSRLFTPGSKQLKDALEK